MNWPWVKLEIQKPNPKGNSETALILEMLEIESMSASMISRQGGINRHTVAGILQALEDLGYVYRQPVPPSILYHLSEVRK